MGADLRQLKKRIHSVESTRHITRAMQLVSASKMKRAAERLDRCRAYAGKLRQIFASADGTDFSAAKGAPPVYIVIAGDRGLAGGYNNAIYKAMAAQSCAKEAFLIPIGARAVDYFTRHGYRIHGSFESVENLSLRETAEAARALYREFCAGEIGEVYVLYTAFCTALTQQVTQCRLFPPEPSGGEDSPVMTPPEPDAGTVFAAALPEYLTGCIFHAAAESYASELAARRNAMESATKNAGEMIDALNLSYNRARQGAITQEITEIIGGAAEG